MRVIEQAAKVAFIAAEIMNDPEQAWDNYPAFRPKFIAAVEAALKVIHDLSTERTLESLGFDVVDGKTVNGTPIKVMTQALPPPLPDDLWNRVMNTPIKSTASDVSEHEYVGHRYSQPHVAVQGKLHPADDVQPDAVVSPPPPE